MIGVIEPVERIDRTDVETDGITGAIRKIIIRDESLEIIGVNAAKETIDRVVTSPLETEPIDRSVML